MAKAVYVELYNAIRAGKRLLVHGVSGSTLRSRLSTQHAAARREALAAGINLPDSHVWLEEASPEKGGGYFISLRPGLNPNMVARSKASWSLVDDDDSQAGEV